MSVDATVKDETPLWPAVKQTFKTNFPPGIVLFSIGLTILIVFFSNDDMRDACEAYAVWYNDKHILAQQLSSAFFAGWFPFVLDHWRRTRAVAATGKKIVPEGQWDDLSTKAFWINQLFMSVFWYYKGIEISYFYKLQAYLFGDGTSFSVLIPKILVDQLIYNPFYGIWTVGIPYSWKAHGYDWARTKEHITTKHFIYHEQLLLQVSIWIVWFPMVSLVYSLPQPLQIPFWNIAMVFSSLVFMTLVNSNQEHAEKKKLELLTSALAIVDPCVEKGKGDEACLEMADIETNIELVRPLSSSGASTLRIHGN